VGGAGSQDQVVVRKLSAGAKSDDVIGDVNADHFVHQNFGILLAAQDGADRLCDLCRGENGERNLVKKRLKNVVIAAVDHGYVDGQMRQAPRGIHAGKSPPDDDDAGTRRMLTP
jgi:hypothetical protein